MAGGLKLYNTLTRDKVDFETIDPHNVRLYVCGPTVYDFAHIGNARPVIVFAVLYRLLRHPYGADKVTYVRNITDVDDKINARALRDFGGQIADGSMSLNEAIRAVTGKTESQFHEDVASLGCLRPTVEPRATDNIPQMIVIIQRLLDMGHAYVASGSEGHEVLFSTASMADYGMLSKRKLQDQQVEARLAAAASLSQESVKLRDLVSQFKLDQSHAQARSLRQTAAVMARPSARPAAARPAARPAQGNLATKTDSWEEF